MDRLPKHLLISASRHTATSSPDEANVSVPAQTPRRHNRRASPRRGGFGSNTQAARWVRPHSLGPSPLCRKETPPLQQAAGPAEPSAAGDVTGGMFSYQSPNLPLARFPSRVPSERPDPRPTRSTRRLEIQPTFITITVYMKSAKVGLLLCLNSWRRC